MKNHVSGYMIFHDISMFSFFISANILCRILHRIIAYHDHTRISNILNLQLYLPIHANTHIPEKSCSNTDNDKR